MNEHGIEWKIGIETIVHDTRISSARWVLVLKGKGLHRLKNPFLSAFFVEYAYQSADRRKTDLPKNIANPWKSAENKCEVKWLVNSLL